MARVHYERLSDEGAAYLANETSRRREHTAMILVFEGGALATGDGGANYARIREIVESRLPELPRLRTKLRRVPIENHPVWVDDREFNLDYHLRHASLPRPGSHDQLCRVASRIAATRLDRSRPLWDCWVLEGLEGGRFALVLKMHKALAPLEGTDLFRALLSADPTASTPSATGRLMSRPAPSPVELFASEVVGRWSPSRKALARAVDFVTTPGRAGRQVRRRAGEVLKVMGYQLRPAGESPFDGHLSPHRSFAVQEVDLESVQAIRQALGGTVHDVVLAVLSGALRRFVSDLRVSPEALDLRAVTPILGASGENASAWVLELPIWEPTGEGRRALVSEQTGRIRDEADVAGGEALSSGDQWNAARLFAIGARALKHIDTGQIAILQSPGPKRPLYLDGVRLEECYGILPLQDMSGLGITALSYDGSLFFAFNADPDLVADVRRLRDAVDHEIAEMLGLVESRAPALRAVGDG